VHFDEGYFGGFVQGADGVAVARVLMAV